MSANTPLEGSSDGAARSTRRLNLHIPNSYPRATSPRTSPLGSPSPVSPAVLQPDESTTLPEVNIPNSRKKRTYGSISPPDIPELRNERQRAPPIDEEVLTNSSTERTWKDYFRTNITSGESSRDFLARERTYFSWLRLAMFLAIASVALFLRLRLRIFSSVGESDLIMSTSNDTTRNFAKALAKKALRKRLSALQKRSVKEFSTSFAASQSTMMMMKMQQEATLSPYPNNKDDSNDGLLDSIPAFSKTLGILFSILAVVALITGHVDYMRTERALEEADKLILMNEQDPEYDPTVQLHNARWAKQAHSNRLVRIVELIIAAAIFAVALIILVTVNQSNIVSVPSI